MLSSVSLARLSTVHPELNRRIIKLDVLIPSLNIQVTAGYRNFVQQDALYAQGRTTPGPIVTNATGAKSSHCYGYSVDLVPEDMTPGQPDWNASDPAWQKMLSAGLAVGLAEGAQWEHKDNPHFYLQELPATPTDEMYTAFMNGGLAAVWQLWTNILQMS